MKFNRTFNIIKRLNNNELNVTDIVCTLNRKWDEVIKAEGYMRFKSGDISNNSRAIYSFTNNFSEGGYYVLTDNNAFVIALGISNDTEPKSYHMQDEFNLCETDNIVQPSDHKKRSVEMFRIPVTSDLGRDVLYNFKVESTPANYQVVNNPDIPINLGVYKGQIIFSY